MHIVIDIETERVDLDRGELPKHIWLVVCKEIETGKYFIFRNVTEDEHERERCNSYIRSAARSPNILLGHNICGFDWPVLLSALELRAEGIHPVCLDTLIISKLVDYPRKGHSIEDYGEEFGIPKGDNKSADFFKKWSQELEDYCIRDVDICERIYCKYKKYITDPAHDRSIKLEHDFQFVVNDLTKNGFSFNVDKATSLLEKVATNLGVLDDQIKKEFPDRLKLIREITPKVTKHGTLSRTDFRWLVSGDLSEYNGGPFSRCEWVSFNAASHKQLIDVLHQAGWQPTDKTQSHIDTDREISRLKRSRESVNPLDLEKLSAKLEGYQKYGWKINELNLSTLPPKAPASARILAQRILLEARRRTLTEWLELVHEDGRIHGRFQGIGAWSQRMSHQNPNTANIPSEFDTEGKTKFLGKEMRSLWRAPKNRLLAGSDAEGIQLRIFAHYINDEEFTHSLVKGKKDDKTDPHSLNQRVLGPVCKSRAAAKRFIYALLLGAGIGKLAQILVASRVDTEEALERLIQRYEGFATLKKTSIPNDAKRGWFIGLDGRKVRIPGDTVGERKHLCMSGYLQNGEAVVVKNSVLKTLDKIKSLPETDKILLVNIVHDEVIFETPNNVTVCEQINRMFNESIEEVGVELNLRCPLKGDGHVGLNWWEIH